MGLPSEEIHFSTSAPTLDAIYQAICDIEGTDVPAMMKRNPAPPRITNAPPKPASRSFAPDSLRLYGAKTNLTIHVSDDGQSFFAFGNATTLLRSSRLALEKLGGTVVSPTPGVRRRMPVWAWPWYLVAALFSLLATACIGLPLVIFVFAYLLPMEFLSKRRERRQEKTLPRKMASVRRFMPASLLDAMLNSGKGTLIIEHLSLQGFVREWWTAEDVIGNAPVPLPATPILLSEENQSTALHAYALSCIERYTDPMTGSAKLTETVPGLSESHRTLAEKYPRAKIVVLFVFGGDAEQPLIFTKEPERIADSEVNRG
jgi:hypothetical protein